MKTSKNSVKKYNRYKQIKKNQWKEEQIEYQYNDIVGYTVRDGIQYVKIQWKGYPKEEATWEPLDYVGNYEEYQAKIKGFIEQYQLQNRKQQQKKLKYKTDQYQQSDKQRVEHKRSIFSQCQKQKKIKKQNQNYRTLADKQFQKKNEPAFNQNFKQSFKQAIRQQSYLLLAEYLIQNQKLQKIAKQKQQKLQRNRMQNQMNEVVEDGRGKCNHIKISKPESIINRNGELYFKVDMGYSSTPYPVYFHKNYIKKMCPSAI